MSSLKEIAKNGWQPGNSGSGGFKDKWRDDFKGLNQVAGWMGKGKGNNQSANTVRSPRPLQSLKDPDIYGPPPKRIISHIDDGSSGHTLSSEKTSLNDVSKLNEMGRKPIPPPIPNRISGKRPTSPRLYSSTCSDQAKNEYGESSLVLKVKPSLPPRLPPRNISKLTPSVPKKSEPNLEEKLSKVKSLDFTSATQTPNGRHDLFSNFMSKPKPKSGEDLTRNPRTLPPLPAISTNTSSGTSFTEKKAAVKTVFSLRNDPSSVSISDVKEAAYTTNNFRERHGEQVKSGWQLAGKVNQQHGIAQKLGSLKLSSEEDNQRSANHLNEDPFKNIVMKKKPPPPPPIRNNALSSKPSSKSYSPIIPTATKPKWGPQ